MKKLPFLLIPFLLCGCSSNNDSSTSFSSSSSIEESSSEQIKRTKVVVLAGQSNMEGNSNSLYLSKHYTKDEIREFTNGYPTCQILWNNNRGKYKNVTNFIDIKLGQGLNKDYFGPEVGIADKISKNTNEEIYFIKMGWGGTNLYEQWTSPNGGSTGELWRVLIDLVSSSLSILDEDGLNPVLSAFCWMQGESDSDRTESIANMYYYRWSNFVTDFSDEFEEYAPETGIKYVDAYISDSVKWPHYQIINAAKQRLADEKENVFTVDTLALELPYQSEPTGTPDLYHYDADGMIKLGQAFGEVLLEKCF